jgi:hypothetical protein
MATSFGLEGHHQAISHKFKKSGTYSAKSSIYMGLHLHVFCTVLAVSLKHFVLLLELKHNRVSSIKITRLFLTEQSSEMLLAVFLAEFHSFLFPFHNCLFAVSILGY